MHVIATLTLIEPNRAYTATIVRGPYLLLLGGRDWRDKQLNRVRTANPCLLVQLSTASDVYRTFHSKDVIQLVEWLLFPMVPSAAILWPEGDYQEVTSFEPGSHGQRSYHATLFGPCTYLSSPFLLLFFLARLPDGA